MAKNTNSVMLTGNLTRDPELKTTSGGMEVCNASIATNRDVKTQSGEWESKPSFVDVTIFGKRGEAFHRYHRKGDPCYLHGELRSDQWEDRETGKKRTKVYVVANHWEFHGRQSEGLGERRPNERREPARSAPSSNSGFGFGSPDGAYDPSDDPF